MVCKTDVFGVVTRTQIQDSTQTNSIMGLKCVWTNVKKIYWYSCVPTVLEECFNSPQNIITFVQNTSKSLKIHAKTLKNLSVTRYWSRILSVTRFWSRTRVFANNPIRLHERLPESQQKVLRWSHIVRGALSAQQGSSPITQTQRVDFISRQMSAFGQKTSFQLILSVFYYLETKNHVVCVGLYGIFWTSFAGFNWFLAYFLLENIGFWLNEFVDTECTRFSGPVWKFSTES